VVEKAPGMDLYYLGARGARAAPSTAQLVDRHARAATAQRPKRGQHPVWFVLDELASLQKLPQLHTAITENRKSRNPIVLGFQGKAQLE